MKAIIAALAVIPTSGCAGLAFTLANLPTKFDAVERRSDIAYGEHPRQTLDVYSPPAHRTAELQPLVIFWYGGGFTHGRKEDYRFVGSALAAEGFVVVVPDYRTHPAVAYPELLRDPARAVAWSQRHARELGADPARIVLMGHSAGAYLAGYLALERTMLEAEGANVESIRGLVGLSGPYALEPSSSVLREIFGAPYSPRDWQPVRYASPGDPPALLLHGLEDTVVIAEHARVLQAALARASVCVETTLYADRNHRDTIAAFAWLVRRRTPALEHTVRFIEHVTAAGAPACRK